MRVIVPPVLVGDRILRIIAPIPSLLEVEEWMGEWWEPSTASFGTVSNAPPASHEVLEARGVPPTEWGATAERLSSQMIDAMMLAHVRTRPPSAGVPVTEGRQGRRKKSYPGSARFGKGAREKTDRRKPGGDLTPLPLGPRRRRTDQPRPAKPPIDRDPPSAPRMAE